MFVTFHCVKRKMFIHHCNGFPFLEEIYLKHMHLDLKSADFVVGKRLNTTNTMRLGIVMLSWQPCLGLLICCFIYSVELKSKQHSEIFSCTVLRKSVFTNHRGKERSCSLPEKAAIIIFPISISIMFLNVR